MCKPEQVCLIFLNIQTIPLDPTNSSSSPKVRVLVPACAVIVQAVAGGELERCYSLKERHASVAQHPCIHQC